MSNDLELLTRAYADQLQELDEAAAALLTDATLDAAVGVQLDGLGQILGVERHGFSDDHYRSLLRGQIRINTSGGTVEQLNDIARLTSNTTTEDAAFSLTEGDIAEFLIEFTQSLSTGLGLIVAEAIYQGKAAGIHGVVQYHETEPVFAFDGFGGSQMGNDPLPGDGGYYLRGAARNAGARESEIL
jgi:hypothetical protein